MLVLITYDVSTLEPIGQKRLRHVAKICTDYGQRVQNSVFECAINTAQLRLIKDKLLKEIDIETDSLRFYILGDNYANKVEHYGAKPSFDVTKPLVL